MFQIMALQLNDTFSMIILLWESMKKSLILSIEANDRKNCLLDQIITRKKSKNMILQTIPFVRASALSFSLIPSPFMLALFYLPDLGCVGYLFKTDLMSWCLV